jgi:hypothetical protein
LREPLHNLLHENETIIVAVKELEEKVYILLIGHQELEVFAGQDNTLYILSASPPEILGCTFGVLIHLSLCHVFKLQACSVLAGARFARSST